MKNEDSFSEYNSMVGKQVRKKGVTKSDKKHLATKPFKSGLKINTVNGIINHPILNIPAYTFVEDDSYVECRRCEIV